MGAVEWQPLRALTWYSCHLHSSTLLAIYLCTCSAQALVWDADLAKRAQDWADLCTRQHSSEL